MYAWVKKCLLETMKYPWFISCLILEDTENCADFQWRITPYYHHTQKVWLQTGFSPFEALPTPTSDLYQKTATVFIKNFRTVHFTRYRVLHRACPESIMLTQVMTGRSKQGNLLETRLALYSRRAEKQTSGACLYTRRLHACIAIECTRGRMLSTIVYPLDQKKRKTAKTLL